MLNKVKVNQYLYSLTPKFRTLELVLDIIFVRVLILPSFGFFLPQVRLHYY